MPAIFPNLRLGPQTLDEKLQAVRQKYPYASFPADFGSHPADVEALNRLSSPLPEWAQKAGAKVADFFGGGTPEKNSIVSRVGSMRSAGGKSISDATYNAKLNAGRMLVEHMVPGGSAGKVGQAFTRANQLYNQEIKGLNMSARGVMSAKSMFGDLAEMSGYMMTPNGGYVSKSQIDPEIINDLYSEAYATGVDPAVLAQEKLPYYAAMASERGQEMMRQQAASRQPIWQNEDGSYVTSESLTEGQASSKVMRYVPKFLEKNDQT